MLSYEIIKVKPRIQAPVTAWTAPIYENRSNITCQEHLDEYLRTEVLTEGSFVRYRNGMGDVISPHQLNVVLCVQKDWKKIKISYGGFPETHLLLQCTVGDNRPWIRWADIREYVEVSQATKEKFVNAKLLDYIQEVKSASEMYKEATAQSC